jgi:hypothetical protein
MRSSEPSIQSSLPKVHNETGSNQSFAPMKQQAITQHVFPLPSIVDYGMNKQQ